MDRDYDLGSCHCDQLPSDVEVIGCSKTWGFSGALSRVGIRLKEGRFDKVQALVDEREYFFSQEVAVWSLVMLRTLNLRSPLIAIAKEGGLLWVLRISPQFAPEKWILQVDEFLKRKEPISGRDFLSAYFVLPKGPIDEVRHLKGVR